MKKFILSLFLSLSILCSFAQAVVVYSIDAGGTVTIDVNDVPDIVFLTTDGSPMPSSFEIQFSTTPVYGTVCKVFTPGVFDRNGNNLIIFGDLANSSENATMGWVYQVTVDNTGAIHQQRLPVDFTDTQLLDGSTIKDGTLGFDALVSEIPLSVMDTLGRGRIIYGKASNVMSSLYAAGNAKLLIGDGTDLGSVAVTGDIGITNAGVTSISSGVIVNADVNSAAAIAFSKMAALTASKAVVTNSSGVITTANQLSAGLGGTAQDFSASTGFQTWSAGTASVGTITESESIWVSFESGYQCDNKIKMPCAGTITGLYAYAVKDVAGTDNGTIVAKNAAGTTMTSGTITFTASDPQGTAYTSTPSTNNTFSAGDVLYFTTAKTTAGGVVELTVTYTRSN
jgi:hypothetical protein